VGSSTVNSRMTGPDANVRQAIGLAASRTGVDFGYLWNQARVESSLNPGARSGSSSAAGLFQFVEQTWLATVKTHGAEHGYGRAADAITQRRDGRYVVADPSARQAILAMRYDAAASSAMAAEFASDNARHLSGRIGRTPNSTDLYFAHFLGAGGATRFLKAAAASPDGPAAAQFPRAAAANRSIFYTRNGTPRSFAEIYALMGRKLSGTGGALPATTLAAQSVAPAPSPIEASASMTQPDSAAELVKSSPSGGGLRIDMLRPSPQSARLAYMLVVSTIGSGSA